MRDLLESRLCIERVEYLGLGILGGGLGVNIDAVWTVVLGPYYRRHRISAQPK